MIKVAGIDYLPMLRMGFTPFGLEYHFENYIRHNDISALVDIKYGDQTFHSSWGGLGIDVQNIYNNNQFVMDVKLDVWTQPELKSESKPVNNSNL